MHPFTGWTPAATAFLAEVAHDNTREFWAAHGHRHEVGVRTPTRQLAAELQPEFGPMRVFRPLRNRRFRPDSPPYRTDTGGVVVTAGGVVLAVVLTAAELTATAGIFEFDAGQLRRYRAAVDASAELLELLAALDDLTPQPGPSLRTRPRGAPADHPRVELLRRKGLVVGRTWEAGEWLGTRDPLDRVRATWRAAAPLVRWLEDEVGPADPVPPRPRPSPPPTSDVPIPTDVPVPAAVPIPDDVPVPGVPVPGVPVPGVPARGVPVPGAPIPGADQRARQYPVA